MPPLYLVHSRSQENTQRGRCAGISITKKTKRFKFPKNLSGPTFQKTSVQGSLHPLTHFSSWKTGFCFATSDKLSTQMKRTSDSDQHVWMSLWTSTDINSSSTFVEGKSSSQSFQHSVPVNQAEKCCMVIFYMAFNQINFAFIEQEDTLFFWTLSPSAVLFLNSRRQHGLTTQQTHKSFSLFLYFDFKTWTYFSLYETN